MTLTSPILNRAQVQRLQAFATQHGRTWKSKLRDTWARNLDVNEPELRQVRNILGPIGLRDYTLDMRPFYDMGGPTGDDIAPRD